MMLCHSAGKTGAEALEERDPLFGINFSPRNIGMKSWYPNFSNGPKRATCWRCVPIRKLPEESFWCI